MKTFDIFDTLITRSTATPKGIFAIMQYRIMNEDKYRDLYAKLLDNWFYVRIAAESEMRRYVLNAECTFDEIYSYIKKRFGLSDDEKFRLKELELEVELANVIPVRKNIQQVKEVVNSGEQVALISDMYLSSKDIRRMLTSVDDIFKGIPIYVSNEYRCNKRTGELFSVVRDKLQQETWVHMGDNPVSDVKGAELAGITGVQYEYEQLTAGELNLLKYHEDDAVIQLYVGASRNYRINECGNIASKAGATVGVEVLLPYAYWVVDACKLKKIDKLFFVARDGYVVKEIVDQIIRNENLNLKTSYIYGSREVWSDLDKDISESGLADGEKIERARKYIQQEILCEDIHNIGFVEMNSVGGRTQEHLCNYIRQISDCVISNFYYNLLPRMMSKKNYMHYAYYKGDGKDYLDLVEMLARALHGRTVDYRVDGERYVPVLEEGGMDEGKQLEECGYADYIDSIWKVAGNLIDEFEINRICKKNDNISIQAMQYLAHEQKDDVFEFFCDLPRENRGVYYKHAAPQLSARDILGIYMFRESAVERNVLNLKFSVRRMKRKELILMRFCQTVNNHIYRLRSLKLVCSGGDIKENIIVYGAGSMGTELVRKIDCMKGKNLILWLDSNPNIVENDAGVFSIDKIRTVKFDQIIIAVKNVETAVEIKKKLVGYKVPRRKIYWWNGKNA